MPGKDNTAINMIRKWLNYYNQIKDRLHIDRAFFSDAKTVLRFYAHYKWGSGKQKFAANEARPKIAFFPQPVGPWYNIWLTLQNTKLETIDSVSEADYVFIFDDATYSNAANYLPKDNKAILINDQATDISKSYISRVFEQIFGYEIEIDPTTYKGRAVEKSDENGTHDGRLITCPIPKEKVRPDCCYQKFIDSAFTGKTSEDLRILCVFGEVAAVYHKHKAFDKRFSTTYLNTTVHPAEDRFSAKELDLIKNYCDSIGLDFGAIDVMRDKHDNKIYIVDVNKTCMPVMSLPYAVQYQSMAKIGAMFERYLPPLKPN